MSDYYGSPPPEWDNEPCCDGCTCHDPDCPHEHCTCAADARRREGEHYAAMQHAWWRDVGNVLLAGPGWPPDDDTP